VRNLASMKFTGRPHPFLLAAALILALLFGIAAAWHWTPLRYFIEVDRVTEWSRPFGSHPAAPVIVTAAYTLGTLVMFPRPILTVASVLVFGPFVTFLCALSGLLFAALLSFWAGRRLGSARLRHFAGAYLNQLGRQLRRKGFWAVIFMRLVPVAPFTVVNIIAGAVRIRAAHFFFGTLLGLLPGILTTIALGDRLLAAWRRPSPENILLLLLVSIIAAVAIAFLWRKTPEKLAS
jgi:uncharacterized membrane protein YdjX (TVP38/TMEM64 family)